MNNGPLIEEFLNFCKEAVFVLFVLPFEDQNAVFSHILQGDFPMGNCQRSGKTQCEGDCAPQLHGLPSPGGQDRERNLPPAV